MINHIKENIKRVKKSMAFAYFLLIMVIFLPTAITMPSLSFRSAIITAIGIDKLDDEIEVSVLSLANISKDNLGEKAKVISGVSSSVANAISSIEAQIGRRIRMGHVGYIVISQDIATENVPEILNTLIITSKLPNTVSLVMSKDNAKDVLTQANKLEQTSSFKLREVIHNEFNETYTKDTSVDAFMKGYLSEISTSTMGYITLEKNSEEGLDASEGGSEGQSSTENKGEQSGQQSSSQSQQNSSGNKSVVYFNRNHAVFVNGKFKYILTDEEMKGVNWLAESNLQKNFVINNVNDQGLSDAQVTFEVINEKVQPKVLFRNNKPTIIYDMSLYLNVVEIKQDEKNKISLKDFVLSDVVKRNIEDTLKKEISQTLKTLRKEKTDVVGIYKVLYNDYNKFMNFLDTLTDKKDFLSYVQIKINVSSQLASN